MKIRQIMALTGATVVCGNGREDHEVQCAFASDLMSDVLTLDCNGVLLVTGLCNMQTIRTAEMADVSCILFVRGKKATPDILQLAACELYFMSVNPVNRLMLPNAGRADRSEAAVRSFNQYMKANLSSAYTYIDMYSYLKSTGYSFASDHYGTGTVDDGLHYTTRTYKRIFAKCMDSLRVPA